VPFAAEDPFLVVSTNSEETTCSLGEDEKTIPPGTTFYSSNWSRESAPARLGLSPVELFDLRFSDWARMSEDSRARLCTGTPLTFSVLEERQHTRGELTIDGLRLSDYQLKDSMQRATGIGIAVP